VTSSPTLQKVSSSTLTVALISAAVVLAIRASTRATTPKETTEPLRARLCKNCGHREGFHGDRMFGICTYSQYPNQCKCIGWVFWDRDAEEEARRVA